MNTCTRLVVLAFFLALSLPLVSAEGPEELTALSDEIAAAVKAKDAAAASEAFKKVGPAYAGCEDKAARGKLLAAVGKALKSKDLEDAAVDAVEGLVATGDGPAAWKVLSKSLPDAKKVEEATKFQLAVATAAGSLADPRAIKPLTELAYKSKDNQLAAAAALSLGGFGKDEKNRVKVLEELMDIGKRTRPGQSSTSNPSPAAKERWQAVGPSVIEALNKLTGQKRPTFEEWEEAYKGAKKKPSDLFVGGD